MTTEKDKRTIALQKDINALLKEQKEIKEDLAKTTGEYNKEITKVLSISQKLLVTSAERKQMALEEVSENQKIEQQKLQLANSIREEMKKRIELLTDAKELDREELDIATKKLDAAHQNQKLAKDNLENLKDQASSIKAQQTVNEKAVGAFSSIAGSMGIARSEVGGMVKGMAFAYVEAVKTDGLLMGTLKTVGSIAMAFWDVFNPVNLISSLISKIMTASVEFLHTSSAALASFSAAAGDAGAMASDVGAAMSLGTGVNITQAAQAAGALAGAWQGMADASSNTRTQMIRTGAEFERIGWSATDFGKSLTFMTKGLGMSAEEAEHSMKGLASAALDLGMTPAEVGANLSQLQGNLALYGGRIGDKFIEIAAAAKAAGLEMADVVALGEKFDTFEGAASTVGQLNAYLGGPMLNSLEMFQLQAEKGPAAVQKAVVSALKASGKTFLDMNYAEKKAFAETLDMKVDAFGALMGYQDDEAIASEKAAKKEAAQQKRYQKMLRSTISLAEQIQYFFQSVFAHPAVISALKDFFGVLYGDKTKKGLGAVTKLIGNGMAIAIKVATKVLGRLVEIFNTHFGPSLEGAAEGVKVFGRSFKGLDEFVDRAATYIAEKFGQILGAIKGVIEWMTSDKSFWDTSFGDWLQKIALYAGAFVVGIMAITALLFWASPAIAGALFAIGTGGLVLVPVLLSLALVFASMAIPLWMLAKVIGKVADVVGAFADVFYGIGDAIHSVGVFIKQVLGIVMDQGIVKAAMMAAFIVTLGNALGKFAKKAKKIPTKKLEATSKFITTIKSDAKGAADGLNMMAKAATKLSKAMSGTSMKKLTGLSWNVTSVMRATALVKQENVDGAVKIIEKAKEYQEAIHADPDKLDAVVELIKATRPAGATAGGGGGAPINITLELGGTVLEKYIWDSVTRGLIKRT